MDTNDFSANNAPGNAKPEPSAPAASPKKVWRTAAEPGNAGQAPRPGPAGRVASRPTRPRPQNAAPPPRPQREAPPPQPPADEPPHSEAPLFPEGELAGATAEMPTGPHTDDPLGALDISQESKMLKTAQRDRRIRILFAALFPVFALLLTISLWQIFSIQKNYKEADDEYNSLRQQAFPSSSAAAADAGAAASASEEEEEPEPALTLPEVMARNTDCVGWIEIPGSPLSYPVVRGQDNEEYLNRTFLGNQNTAGAIFMDYRNNADFSGQHLLIYGHNLKNGSMFGSLYQYKDAAYMSSHPTVTLQDGQILRTYRVFAARVVDMYDAGYQMEFADEAEFQAFASASGAPGDVSQMLTLSTCTNVSDEECLIVLAYLEGTSAAPEA